MKAKTKLCSIDETSDDHDNDDDDDDDDDDDYDYQDSASYLIPICPHFSKTLLFNIFCLFWH